MIVALLLAPKPLPEAEEYFQPVGEEGPQEVPLSTIERVAGSLVRGPFGGVVAAAHPEISQRLRDQLQGFTLQFADVPTAAQTPQEILAAGLAAASAFRARWERARAAAQGRFEKKPEHETKAEWSKHKQHADVKVRGLARSFDRDGVLIVPADCFALRPEQLAQIVEAFARDGQSAAPRACAQCVRDGIRDWPVLLSLDAAQEVQALAPSADLIAWLMDHIERVQDVRM